MDEHARDARLQQLEARTYHIDGEVAAIKTQLAGQAESLERIENTLLNKQPVWNTGSVVALVSLLATILLGGGVFLDSQLGHVRDDIVQLQDNNKVQEEFRHQAHYEVGVATRAAQLHEDEINKLWDHIHKQEDVDTGQDKELAGHGVRLDFIEGMIRIQ